MVSAIMAAHEARETMSTQALNSEITQRGMLDTLLNHLRLYEAPRDRWEAQPR